MDEPARYLVYSVTKTYLAVLCLRLELELDAEPATWLDDPGLPRATLRQLLNHTSGLPDYGRLPAYAQAVRDRPSDPWDDEQLLAAALGAGADFDPGDGWAYSNTGYLLVRRILEVAAPEGLAALLDRELLHPLGLADTSLALELADLEQLQPAPSSQIGPGEQDVRGRYHPCWVGHRTLASTTADQHRFWQALAAGGLCELAELTAAVAIGAEAPGFVRPSYGLGVMVDPAHPGGLLLGHGGGGPGYAAAAFALAGARPAVEVVLSADESAPAIQTALERLAGGSGGAGRAAPPGRSSPAG